MLIRENRIYDVRGGAETPEADFLNRRQLIALGGLAAGSLLAPMRAFGAEDKDPTLDLYPAAQNKAFTLDRSLTPEEENLKYNNFYEFGSHKQIARAAQALPIRPWTVTIDGKVEKEMTIDIDRLIRKMSLQERLYRHRCVEAWSMTIPWTGFPISELVKLAKPVSGAKYIRMETFMNKDVAEGQRAFWQPWPYVEGLTIEEAMNDLAFLATGAYGKPLAKQLGSPLRLAVPWKYGFKSIKSITRFTFTDERPVSFWESLQAAEYGFWANVNPEVPHRRWSQATERVLHTGKRVPTLLFNGYGEQVADLYKDLADQPLYM